MIPLRVAFEDSSAYTYNRMLKNYQKLEFNLGHLGTGGKLYFHEYLQKKIKKFKPLAIQAFFVFPTPTVRGKKSCPKPPQ